MPLLPNRDDEIRAAWAAAAATPTRMGRRVIDAIHNSPALVRGVLVRTGMVPRAVAEAPAGPLVVAAIYAEAYVRIIFNALRRDYNTNPYETCFIMGVIFLAIVCFVAKIDPHAASAMLVTVLGNIIIVAAVYMLVPQDRFVVSRVRNQPAN